MPSPDELRVLRKEVEVDLAAVHRLMPALADARDRLPTQPTQENLSHLGYLLHGLYTAWESAFHRIATVFENRLDPAQWHHELLRRMTLDLTPIRPRVIDTKLVPYLAELRSFRHFFRHSYAAELRADKIQLVLQAYDAIAGGVGEGLRHFIDTVAQIADQSEDEPI